MATATHATRLEAGRRVFTRIVVGIDGSQQALEAARQAALLQDVDGQLTLFSAWDIASMFIGGTGTEIPYYFDEELQRTTAEKALLAARHDLRSNIQKQRGRGTAGLQDTNGSRPFHDE